METSPLKGFVTRMVACERFDVSDRSIGRYLKRAMTRGDAAFLRHFKLATLDNEIIDGPKVSLELISDLQAQKRVPTWYVSSDWLQQNFDSRDNATQVAVDDEHAEAHATERENRGDAVPDDWKDQIIAILKAQLSALEIDKQRLEDEKKEMRQDARETREFMNRMQQLMVHMQDRLLPEKTGSNVPTNNVANVQPVEVDHSQPEKGTRSDEQPTRRKSAQPRSPQRRTPTPTTRPPRKRLKSSSIWQRDVREILSLLRK